MNKNIKSFFTFLLIIWSFNTYSQHFDWAATGVSLYEGFEKSTLTKNGRLVAGMTYRVPSQFINNEKSVLISSNGDEKSLVQYQNQAIVVSYSNLGNIEWIADYNIFGNDSRFLGITSKSDGEIIVAFTSTNFRFDTQFISSKKTLQENENQKSNRSFVYFSIFDTKGNLINTFANEEIYNTEWNNFEYSEKDKSFVIAYTNHEKTNDAKGQIRDVGHNYTIKLNNKFQEIWKHKAMYLDESCCTFSNPSTKIAIAKNGDIYITGTTRFGVRLDGTKDKMAPIIDEVTKYNKPSESYLAKLNMEGKLIWVKYSDAKSVIYDIKATDKNVVFSGNFSKQKKLFGEKIDTTDSKIAFLASFNSSGKVNFIKTFNASTIDALSIDNNENIYASFQSKRGKGSKPLIIEKDSISNSFFNFIIVSFDSKGNYKWNKKNNIPLSNNPNINLHNDNCGNLYFSGTMWFVLPINMNIFDAAIIKGKGYGGAPIAARLKTTIPNEVLSYNNLENEINEESSEACYPNPFPWEIKLFPNPTNGEFTVQIKTSYKDPSVNIELWSLSGSKIRELMKAKSVDLGTFEEHFNINDLATGTYIFVVKGSGTAITERIVLVK